MKISLKKLLFLVLTVFSLMFVGACGKSKINKEEVINKFVEVSKDMKSANMLMDIKMSQKGSKESINMSIDSAIILEPLEMKLEMTVPNQPTKIDLYIKDGYMYVLDPLSNQWMKQKVTDLVNEQFKGYMTNSLYIYDVMKDNIDKMDVDEKDGNYIISISKNSEFLKDAMKKQLSNMNTPGSQLGEQIEIDNIAIQYIVDKNTYLVKNSIMSFDVTMNGEKITINLDTKFSNINEVKEISIPEETKNSEEVPEGQ
jgi:hypothetical protein